MRKFILAIGFTLNTSQAIACGDDMSYRAMDIAALITLGLFALSALLLPAASLLADKYTTMRRMLVLAGIVLTGLLSAATLIAVDSDPYMIPAAVVLIATSLFVPVIHLFLRSLVTFRERRRNNWQHVHSAPQE